MNFTKQQFAAAHASENQVVVVAGAGGGKTAIIIERIKHLINSGVLGSDIVAITHTNNAAQEMAGRVGEEGTHVSFGTIHSLANNILKQNGIDTSRCIEKEDFHELFELIEDNRGSLNIPVIEHLLVDEFQDIGDEQFDFIFHDLQPKNFFIVGDSRQAIYGFTGTSNYKLFENLIRDNQTKVYELNYNFRNLPDIIRFANNFIYNMQSVYQTDMYCKRRGNAHIDESSYSLEEILEYVKNKDSYKDWFILARTNIKVNQIIKFLKLNNIPVDTFKQAERSFSEIQDALNANTVKVLTIHSAKGLEAKNVIVIGASVYSEEERRLCYVGATRAKDSLIWMVDRGGKNSNFKINKYLKQLEEEKNEEEMMSF